MHYRSISEIASLISTRRISVAELLEHQLSRIETLDGELGALAPRGPVADEADRVEGLAGSAGGDDDAPSGEVLGCEEREGRLGEEGPVASFRERQRLVQKPYFDALERHYADPDEDAAPDA